MDLYYRNINYKKIVKGVSTWIWKTILCSLRFTYNINKVFLLKKQQQQNKYVENDYFQPSFCPSLWNDLFLRGVSFKSSQ